MNGLCVAEPSFFAVGTEHLASFLCHHRMNGRNDGYVGTEVAVITYSDLGIILYCNIEIENCGALDVLTDKIINEVTKYNG